MALVTLPCHLLDPVIICRHVVPDTVASGQTDVTAALETGEELPLVTFASVHGDAETVRSYFSVV